MTDKVADIFEKAGAKPPRFRMRLKDGSHMEHDVNGDMCYYQKGDVFLSRYRLYKKDPNKFELVDPSTPLTQELRKFLPENAKLEDDDDDGEMGTPGFCTVPTVPLQRPKTSHNRVSSPEERQMELADDDVLNDMTVQELKDLAAAEEIDVSGCRLREEYLSRIKENRSSST